MNTTYFINLIMGNVFRTKTSPAIPAQCYIGLSTTAPDISGVGVTEPSSSGTGYARVALNSLTEPVNGVVQNREAVTFNESLKTWGTVTHYVVFDAATGGNLLFYGALSSSKTIDPETILTLRANELTITLSNP